MEAVVTAPHSLIGRDRELERLHELRAGTDRIVTVLGPPGVGKTALALTLAQRVNPDPAIVCDLSGVRTEAELEPAVARALDPTSEAARSVTELLRERGRCLLVLDNFEQIIDAGHRLLSWIHEAPQTQLVVTSRERLSLPGEHVFEVRPLCVPDEDAEDAEMLDNAAVRLFSARAQQAGSLGDDDLRAVADIVRALDGLPLAIELAAARRRVFSTRELANRLTDPQAALGWEQRQSNRHRSLQRAIAWSWGLLTEVEQRTLAACSVFASAFEVSDALAVLGPVLQPRDLLETLVALRDKSLLHGTSDGRLGMYSSVGAFAARALSALGTDFEEALRRQHAQIIAALAREHVRAALDLSIDAAPGLFQRALRCRDDLVMALAFTRTQTHDVAWDEARTALACSAAILPALSAAAARRALDGAENECSDPDRTALIVLARHRVDAMRGDPMSLEALDRIADDDRVGGTLRESALLIAGVQRRSDGAPAEALLDHDRLAQARIAGGHARIHAINLACRGRLLGDLQRFEDAIATNEAAVSACEALEQWWLAALALANLAQIEQEQGHFDRADSLLRRAIARFQEADQGRYQGVYSAVHGNLHLERGAFDEACRWYAAGEGFLDKMLSTYPTLVLYGGRAMAEALAGRTTEAEAYIERARRALARVPGTVGEALVRAQSAVVTLAAGRSDAEQRQQWQAWLDAIEESGRASEPPAAPANLDVRFALRMLSQMLNTTSTQGVALVIEDGGRRLHIEGRERIDLGRRATLRRIVVALHEHSIEHPGVALGVDALVERGWPSQTILPDAASTRLRVAISTLRKLGLRPLLLTRDDGYLFDANLRVVVR